MSEKLSDERAIEILRAGPKVYDDEAVHEAGLIGAAAIAAQRELVDALAGVASYILHGTAVWPEEVDKSRKMKVALDLLVRFGRVTKDGDSYRWSKP